MNDVIRAMRAHRSVRAYTDEPIPHEAVVAAVEAGQAAATSSAVQAYCVIRVTDRQHRSRLAELTGPQEKVAVAPEFFIICGDSRRHRLLAERAGERYEQKLEAFLVSVIDATLCAQNMVLAFESMGYGTCYIGGLRNHLAEVDRLLGLPHGVYPLYGLCVGRPAQDPGLRPRLPIGGVLFQDAYPQDDDLLESVAAYDAVYEQYLRERGATNPGGWSAAMAGKFASVTRPDIADYYRSKGAVLD